MYDLNSEEFAKHNIYPSTNVSFVYAVVAMCLELKDAGYTDDRIVPMVEKSMEGRWSAYDQKKRELQNGICRCHAIVFCVAIALMMFAALLFILVVTGKTDYFISQILKLIKNAK